MSGPSRKAPSSRAGRAPRKDAPARLALVQPAPDAALAIEALNAEIERLREAQGMLVSELSIRESEAGAARETLTKQSGDIARTRRSWQQTTEDVSEMRRTLADVDVANAHNLASLREEISQREGRIDGLTAEIAALRESVGAAEDELNTLRAETGAQRGEISRLSEVIATGERGLHDLRAQMARREVEAEAEIRSLRDRLAVRSDELSSLSLQTANRISDLVAASMSQGDTVARLSSELGAVRTDLIRETNSHAEARRAIETGEAVLARVTGDLNEARGLAERKAGEAEQLREQMWSLEKDSSAARQRGAEQDDRLLALDEKIEQAQRAREAAVEQQARLMARLDGDGATIETLRAHLEKTKALLKQVASLPDAEPAAVSSGASSQSESRLVDEALLAKVAMDREIASLRLKITAMDESRRTRENLLSAARRQVMDAEAAATAARLDLVEREAMVSRLADELTVRDGDRTALENRIVGLVRSNDVRQHENGRLARHIQTVSRSSTYRWGLAGAAIARGWRRLVRRLRRGKANPLFDFRWYLDNNPDVRWAGVDPVTHYRENGRAESRTPNRVFQPNWYLETNPDVKAAGVDPLDHYWHHGAAEGRHPAPDFDLHAYLERHPEAKARGRHPLLHFLRTAPADEPLPSGGQRILMVAWHCPTRAHAGGLRMLDLYDYIRRIAPNARLDLFTVRKPDIDWSYEDVTRIFDNVYFTDHEDLSVRALNALRGDRTVYDVVDFQFLEAGHDVDSYRSVGRKLIFTPMELLSRSFHIERHIPGRIATAQRLAEQMEVARRELTLCRAVDEVVCVSRPDADYLRQVTGLNSVTALETGVSTLEFGQLAPADATSRASNTIVFVAYFGSHTNIEALDWYLNEVHPKVKAAIPDYRLDVVGRGDLSRYEALDDPAINLIGEVPSVGPYIARAALGISPALSGAGFRGKINQYAVLGVATVASPIAAEGFAYHHGDDILVGPDAELFAQHCAAMLRDHELNARLAARATQTCLERYSWQAREGAIRSLYGLKRVRKAGAPVVTAIVPSYNHGRYIEARIRSVLDQSYPNIDLIVIDDKSPDDSHDVISRLRDQYGFAYIRRETNSGTPFSSWEYAARNANGDFLWICESDDVAEPDFAATAVDKLCQDRGAALFYCNSHVIDADGAVIGSTASYFRDIWQDARWEASFTAEGLKELADYQVRGMVVPNMSSAMIRTSAFRASFKPDLLKFSLTGDWLFIGRVLTKGRAIFDVHLLNRFRQHGVTSRERVKSAQSQAEFIMTKYRLHKLARKRARDLAETLRTDATRFIYEPASGRDVVRAMWKISRLDTLRAGTMLAWSMLFHRHYWAKFKARVKDRRASPGG
ncbi:MAG: glycosyltransferase [Micropepsaceae bacterium]